MIYQSEKMEYIDTHSHLYDEAFEGEEDAAIERSVKAGVHKIIFPDIDSETRDKMFNLAARHEGVVYPGLGLHPTSVNKDWEKELSKIESYFNHKIWAIGEIGMDLYWSKEFLEEQKRAFREQIRLASKMDLPIIIHSREATKPILDILAEEKHLGLKGVFHAFSGSIETYNEIQKYGNWYIGIGGVVTFKKASIGETIKDIPLERIILETDSPYLTPVPKRGSRNESSYIPYIAQKISSIKELPIEMIAETTTLNASNLFKI